MAAAITDEMLDQYAVTSTWDDLAATLLERYRGLAHRVFAYGAAGDWRRGPDTAERWRSVAADVQAGR